MFYEFHPDCAGKDGASHHFAPKEPEYSIPRNGRKKMGGAQLPFSGGNPRITLWKGTSQRASGRLTIPASALHLSSFHPETDTGFGRGGVSVNTRCALRPKEMTHGEKTVCRERLVQGYRRPAQGVLRQHRRGRNDPDDR